MGGQAFAFRGNSALLLHPAQVAAAQPAATAHPAAVAAPLKLAAVSAQPTAVMRSTDVATVNPNLVRFLNPRFRLPLPSPAGQPRTAFNLPTMVSPTASPTDGALFEAPQNAAQKFFLTDYAIATTGSASAVGKWVTFAPSGSGFLLTVHLADVTAQAKSQGNGRLAPDTRYLLTATVQSRVVSWDLAAAAPGTDGSLTLTLALTDFAGRDLLYAAMTEPEAQAKLIIRRSLPLALPAATGGLYSSTTLAIDSTIGFTFDKDLDAQVFSALHGAGATPLAPWKVLSLDWNGRKHTYYQSASQADQVYFLPDSFKVGRQAAPPHLPDLVVTAQGDTAADMMMTLSYLAVPVWDPKRIAAAAPQLQQTLGLPEPPNMAMFEASSTSLMLSLPGSDPAAGAALTAQSNVLIDLAAGVQGSVTLGLEPFRQLYDALFDPRGTLMSGEVRVTVGDDVTAVPFTARMGDLAGDVFDVQTTVDSKANALVVTLTNAIESPIHVDGLTGVITRDGAPVDGTGVTKTSTPLPTDLAPASAATGTTAAAPAASLTVTMATSAAHALSTVVGTLFGQGGLFGAGQDHGPDVSQAASLGELIIDSRCAPLFDFSQVTINPDPKAMWQAIMANGAPSPINRPVNLKFLAASLNPAAGADAAVAVQIVFQGGQTASFDGSVTADAGGFMNQTVTLSVPIDAFVLQDAPTDSYTYRVDTVTPSGVRKGDWVTDNRDTIYIVPG